LNIMAIGEFDGATKVPADEPEEIMNETLKSLSKDKFEITYDTYLATFVPAN
jgi:hypothetical protein